MQIRVSREPERGLDKKTFHIGDRKIELYLSQAIPLAHGDFLLFDGLIHNYAGKETTHLSSLLSEYSFMDLIDISAEWEGSWAIVYVNPNGNCYCMTDPLGIKQLYYDTRGNISSSAMTISKNSPADEVYKSCVSKWGYNYDNRTPWQNVKRIMPNEVLGFMGSEIFFRKDNYYDWYTFAPGTPNTGSLRMQVHYAVEDSIRSIPERAKSIGVLLSGGLDSSIIAHELLMFKRTGALGGRELNFYTINNEEDAPFVRVFADTFGIEVKSLSYKMQCVNILDALIVNESPIDLGSMIPNQLMFQAVPDEVIFTGDGADELFGGYRRIDEYDSQKSDIFQELSFYHLPRLERAATFFHKTLITPFLSQHVVKHALTIPFNQRRHKACLKNTYVDSIPSEIIDRPKLPLKNESLRKDPLAYRYEIIDLFYSKIINHEIL